MSESRNPLDIWSESDFGRGVAILDGFAVCRQELIAHNTIEKDLVTLIRARGHEHDGDKHIHLSELAHTAVSFLCDRVAPGYQTVEQWLNERAAPVNDQCHPYTEDIEFDCKNPVVLFINGFSGPGYVGLCQEHAWAPISDLDPQVWLPVWVSLPELDELIYNGALRPDWA